jgi:hypothetical protein
MNENDQAALKQDEKVSDGCQSPSDKTKIIPQQPTEAVEQQPPRPSIIKGRSRRRKRTVIIR